MARYQKNCGVSAVSGENFKNSFSKIPYFEKFLKIHDIEVPFLQAQGGFGDRTFCVCDRVGMGYEVCRVVLAHCSTCPST